MILIEGRRVLVELLLPEGRVHGVGHHPVEGALQVTSYLKNQELYL